MGEESNVYSLYHSLDMGKPNAAISRKHERTPVRISVRIIPKGSTGIGCEGEILNLSEGGAYLSAEATFPAGTELRLEIKFSGIKEFESIVTEEVYSGFSEIADGALFKESVVRWQQTQNGFGVEFLGSSPEQDRYIRKVISYYLQLAKAGVSF